MFIDQLVQVMQIHNNKITMHYLLLPANAKKLLGIAKDFAKINVEHMARMFDHYVIVMTITCAENVRCHTTAST